MSLSLNDPHSVAGRSVEQSVVIGPNEHAQSVMEDVIAVESGFREPEPTSVTELLEGLQDREV